MDNQETGNPTAEAPPPVPARRIWPVAVAILALGVALFSLATLRGGQQADTAQSADVDLAALSKQGPLAVPLYQEIAKEKAAAPTAAKTVEIMGYKYSPASLSVAVGDTVTWTNHDTAPHNVVVTDGPEKFTSPTLQQGQTFSHTFTKAGNYSYYCSVHPDMKASVKVEGSGTPPTSSPTSVPPSSTPTSSPPHTMPPTTPGGGSCVPKGVLQPIIDHVKAAHLQTSPGQQVQDILNLDQYIKTHTVWLETVLAPLLDGSADKVVADTLAPIVAHLKSAHLETSPGQQVADLLNLDQYIKTHTVWLETVLTPLLDQASC